MMRNYQPFSNEPSFLQENVLMKDDVDKLSQYLFWRIFYRYPPQDLSVNNDSIANPYSKILPNQQGAQPYTGNSNQLPLPFTSSFSVPVQQVIDTSQERIEVPQSNLYEPRGVDNYVPYSKQSEEVICSSCKEQVQTRVQPRMGKFSYLFCCLMVSLGCVCGCCLLPYCCESMQDTYHYCPKCNHQIAHQKLFFD